MMSKTFLLATALLLSSVSQAALRLDGSQFQTDENGFAKAPAEFSGFTISAVTHCDETATAANKSIRELAAKIEEVLLQFADASVEEGIQSFPGATHREELTKYQGGQQILICKGWKAQHSFFFKLAKLSDIPVFQDTILSLNPAEEDYKKAIALSEPKPGIFSKTYEALVDAALKDAHQKANRRAKVLLEDMPHFKDFRLIEVSSSVKPSGTVAYDQTGLGGEPSLSALSSVSVSITRSFKFQLRD